MEGGRNYDSLPGDITLRIFSLLPLYLVLRLRLVCTAWYALITEFAVEYLKRSKETSLGIFAVTLVLFLPVCFPLTYLLYK